MNSSNKGHNPPLGPSASRVSAFILSRNDWGFDTVTRAMDPT
jgi:hypothetical protein